MKLKLLKQPIRLSLLFAFSYLFLVSGCSTTDGQRGKLTAPEGKVLLMGSIDQLPSYSSNITIGLENRDTGFYTNLTTFGSNPRRVTHFAFVADQGTYFFVEGKAPAFTTGGDKYIYLGRFDFDIFSNDFKRLEPNHGQYQEVQFTVSDQWDDDKSWIARNHPEIPLDEVRKSIVYVD